MSKGWFVIPVLLLASCFYGTAHAQEAHPRTAGNPPQVAAGQKAAYEGEAPQAKTGFPISVNVQGHPVGEGTHEVTVTVQVGSQWKPRDIHLNIIPWGNTEIIGHAVYTDLKAGQLPYTATFTIRGNSPAISASVHVFEAGGAVEVHDQYDPGAPRPQVHEIGLEPLPAPIRVEGAIIERGVEVRP